MIPPFVFATSFSDVAPKYEKSVAFLVSKGIQGKADGTFGTQENIKRVDAAVFVVRTLELDTESAPASGFTDVPARAAKEVDALKAAGITSGKTETAFGASDLITRGELALWISKAFELDGGEAKTVFTDVAERYVSAVKALVHHEITDGTSPTSFGTHDYAKRGDFAIFLYRASQVKDSMDVLAIKHVKGINGRQIEVMFNQAIDAKVVAHIGQAGNRVVAFDASQSATTAGFVSEMISFSEDRKSATVILKPTTNTQTEQELAEGKAYTVALVSHYGDYLGFAEVQAESDATILLQGLRLPEVAIDENQNHLIMKFDQKMSEEAKDPANYELFDFGVKVNDPLGEGEWVDATTKTAVRFKINPNRLRAGQSYKIKINPDLEADKGAKLPPSQIVTTFNTPTVAEAQPKVVMARVTGTDEMVVTFDQDLSDIVSLNLYTFKISRANGTTIDVREVRFSGKHLVLTTKEQSAFDERLTYTVSLPAGVAVNDRFRNAVSDEVRDMKAVVAANKDPVAVDAKFVRQVRDKEKADLRLTFDQPVAIKDVAEGDIKIKRFGETYLMAAGTQVEIYGGDTTGKTLVVKDIANAFAIDPTDVTTKFVPKAQEFYQVLIGKGVAKSIAPVAAQDKKSNQAELKTIVDGIDILPPQIDQVILHSAEKITIQFDENIIASGLTASDIKVEGFLKAAGARYESAILTGAGSLGFSVQGDTLTITPATESVKFQTGAIEGRETIVSIGADTIKDENGIENTGMEYAVNVWDTNMYDRARPVMIGAKVTDIASGSLEVTYSEDVYAKAGTPVEIAKQFNVSGAERNEFGSGSTVTTAVEEAKNVFEVTFSSKAFKERDYSSAILIYTHNTNYAIQDREQNKQASSIVVGIFNEVAR